jgi:hypothetical protein
MELPKKSQDSIARKSDGTPIRELQIRSENFLNRSTAVYAASGGGKTSVIRDILSSISKFISICFVWCPTEDQNNGYQDMVPRSAIFTNFDPKDILEMIKNIWLRQEASVIAYKRATNSTVLSRLYNRVAKDEDKENWSAINRTRRKITEEFDNTINTCKPEEKGYYEEEKKAILDHLTLIETNFIRKIIKKYENKLRKKSKKSTHHKLTDEELFTLDHLGFNPGICLIFDDCMHAFTKSVQGKKEFRDLFLAGRHNFITILISVHNRSNLEKTINDNISRCIFCSKKVASLAALRIESASKDDINEFKECIMSVFNPSVQYRKLVYITNSPDPFRWLIAKFHPFESNESKRKYVGSRHVSKFLKAVESNGDKLSKDNPFAKLFNM